MVLYGRQRMDQKSTGIANHEEAEAAAWSAVVQLPDLTSSKSTVTMLQHACT